MKFDAQFALGTALPLARMAYDLSTVPKEWEAKPIEPGSFGFIARHPKATVLSFRGTENESEWLEDFDALAVPNQYGEGLVHAGFQEQANRLRDNVLELCPSTSGQLWITGHSLGAALAVLFASYLSYLLDLEPLVYTFAGPRVGWANFAGFYNRRAPSTFRVVNIWDIVPHLPSVVGGYAHVGNVAQIDGGFEDAHNAHSLDSYERGLKGAM